MSLLLALLLSGSEPKDAGLLLRVEREWLGGSAGPNFRRSFPPAFADLQQMKQ
jgi:hypothetical protein